MRRTYTAGQPVAASQVKAEAYDFLAPEALGNRIPRGEITVVAGRPDQGKGMFAAKVAAEASHHGTVIYSAAEDSMSAMTKPRLEAAGADLDNILLWRFVLPMQMTELTQLVEQTKAVLVVMDPFASHLGGGISRHSDNVREVTDPLADLIHRTKTSVLVIEHALKRVTKNSHALDAIGGSSSGIVAAARAAYLYGANPDDEDKRVMAVAKYNIGMHPRPLQLEMDVEDTPIGEVPFLEVDQELQVFDAIRLVAVDKKEAKVGRPADKRAEACEWLTTYLATNGRTLSSTIQEDAKQHGMSVKTLRRAADDMGIVKSAKGGANVTWDLNDELKTMLGIPTSDAQAPDALARAMGEAQAAQDTDGPEDGLTAAEKLADRDAEEAKLSDDDINMLLGGGE